MKSKYLLLLAASTLVLGSCVTNNQSNDSESTSDTTTPTPEWDADIKEVFEYYAGEVLPYVDLFADTPELYEDVNDSGMPMAVLYDDSYTEKYESAKGPLKGALEGIGWTVDFEEDEEGEYIYAVNYSSDGLNGFELMYWYGSYGNTLQITNWFMTDELSEESEWSAEIAESMIASLEGTLPFMNFGADLSGYQYDEFTFVMYDFYYHDLTSDYAELLSSEGFEKVGYYWVYESASFVVSIDLSYYFGNNVVAMFEPKATETTEWPLNEIAEFLNLGTFYMPAFELEEEQVYSYFIHNGCFYVQSARTTSYEDDYAELLLADTGDYLVLIDDGYAASWYETFFIEFGDIVDDNYDVNGFQTVIYPSEPYDLISGFPVSNVEEALGVSNCLPEFTDHDNRGFKFEIYTAAQQALAEWGWLVLYGYTEEEIIEAFAGDYTDIPYVQEYSALSPDLFDLYVSDFSNIDDPWYQVSLDEEKKTATFEDKSGAVSVTFYDAGNMLSFFFTEGSGVEHERSIELSKHAFKGMKDDTLQLDYDLVMLPDSVVFTSSNEDVATVSDDGLITIVSETIGDKATITATVTVNGVEYKDECAVEVKDVQTVTDTLNQTAFGLTDGDTNYDTHSYTSTDSGVAYSAYCASSQGIQIRIKNSNSGIIGGSDTATCSSITITFGDKTTGDRAVDIYASNEAFTIEDMYRGEMEAVGTIVFDADNPTATYEFEAEYNYIGLRSNDGALYIMSADIVWVS